MWNAYLELASCRPVGFGKARIPWTAIHEYAVANGIDDEARFVRLVRVMDAVILDSGPADA